MPTNVRLLHPSAGGSSEPPTSVFTHWPMVLFPAYLVAFSIIPHITTIRVLLANCRRARDEHTSVATSAMTASG